MKYFGRKKHNDTSSGGIGVFTVVQIVFVILKLVGTINWSWWTVLIPTWISLGLVVLAVIISFILLWLMDT